MAVAGVFRLDVIAEGHVHRTVFPCSAPAAASAGGMEGGADLVIVPDPGDVPRAALGAAYRLDAVRPLFRLTGAAAARDAAIVSRAGRAAGRDGLRFCRGPRSRVPYLQAGRPVVAAGRRRTAGQPGTPPDVSLLTQGYQYLTEHRYDRARSGVRHPAPRPRRARSAAALARSRVRAEPGRAHLPPATGLAPADDMILFRSATKQICRRHGYHASFMCRPRLRQCRLERLASASIAARPKERRQCLHRRTRACCPARRGIISRVSSTMLAAAAAFSTPTINGYKRYRALFAGARPRHLGRGQSRRHGARHRRPRRSRRRGSRTASASPPPTPISIWPRRSSPASTA